MRKLPRYIGVSGVSSSMRVELENIPESMLPLIQVNYLSSNSIPLGDWPEDVFAGRWIVGMEEKLRFFPILRVK